jgi:hypothetical protein
MIARLPKTSHQDFNRFANAEDLDAHMKEFLMASKDQFTQVKNKIFASTLLRIPFCKLAQEAQVYAKDIPNTLPNLNKFIEPVTDGNANALRGVYVSVNLQMVRAQIP